MENIFQGLLCTRDGQLFEEPLIFERSFSGRLGCSLPEDDKTLKLDLAADMIRDESDLHLPEVSEFDVVRHFTRLSTWNYGIDLNLYPLGSCTMKYNPRINEEIAALEIYSDLHPGLPDKYSTHAMHVIYDLQEILKTLTDMKGCTLQPAAGAHGELTGLLMIHAYHKKKGEDRKIVLIPDSAHGTNPATCTLAGFETKEIKSTPEGLLDLNALKESLNSNVAALMITNPGTLGVFEKNIRAAADLLHENGSLLYMDGANYNAILGKASLSEMGVDVSHLNLHKTFSTPHGGGGPGSAAVVASDLLVDFLPDPLVEKTGETYSWKKPASTIGRVKAGPGHFGMILRALVYILTYGNQIHRVAEHAVLNANMVRKKLEGYFQTASPADSMHEAVFSDAKYKNSGFDTLSIAKTLIDYGYHPPTIYFPLSVSGAMMIEPTETESLDRIDHFCQVMIDISNRIKNGDESLKDTPRRAFISRVDEVQAARKPVLNFFTNKG